MKRLVASLLLILSAGGGEPPTEYRESLFVFGTIVEIVVRDADQAQAKQAVKKIGEEFQVMHRDWHAWLPGELTRLNRAFAEGRTMEASPLLLAPLKEAKRFHDLSNGLFNPAIGGLISLWGFHQDDPPSGPLPSPRSIAHWVDQSPGMDDVIIAGSHVSSSNPAVQLDFGGFAKGSALARGVEILQSAGIANAVLNAGGDLIVMGDHGRRPWIAGIRHPSHWGVLASIELNGGEALFTSGNYERFRENEGVHYAHIIDPRSGMPVRHVVSASVIHRDPALADAAATALSVAGPENWKSVAEAFGLTYVVVVDEKGKIYGSPEMLARLRFEDPQ